jgi:hypothetical protein
MNLEAMKHRALQIEQEAFALIAASFEHVPLQVSAGLVIAKELENVPFFAGEVGDDAGNAVSGM